MKTGKTRFWMAAIITLFGFSIFIPTVGAELREEVKTIGDGLGVIDWEQGFIYATAVGTANMAEMVNDIQAESVAKNSARYLAYRALNETVNKVRLNSKSLIEKSIMTDDMMKIETEGILEGAHEFDESFTWTAKGAPRAEITVRLPLNGNLAYVAAKWTKKHDSDEFSLPKYKHPSAKNTSASIKTESKNHYTGLILDARGSGGKPASLPRILSNDGKTLVYGLKDADFDTYISKGLTGYTNTLEKARANPRIGDNPLIVKADKAKGPNKCDYVVPDDAALQIVTADMQSSFLKDCNLVIVLP